MPELPEVQTVVNDLIAAGLEGKSILDVEVYWPKIVMPMEVDIFKKTLIGKTIVKLSRRAKYIVVELSDNWTLLVHLRMTGKFQLIESQETRDKHEHVIIKLNQPQELRYHDTRKFGKMFLLEDPSEILGKLGPEPLERSFNAKLLHKILQGSNRMLKPYLLDQTTIAGLGNIYVDEALWEAYLHPCSLASSVTKDQAKLLTKSIKNVLRKGLKNMGTSLGNSESNFYSVGHRAGRNKDQLNVFRRTDLPCPNCKTKIVKMVVAQRGTHICPKCQKEHLE